MLGFIMENITILLIAIMTIVFTVAIVIVNKSQSKLIGKIDEQSIFIEQEKDINKRLVIATKKRDVVIEKMTMLNMKINVIVISCINSDERKISNDIIKDLKETARELEESYQVALREIEEINNEYDMLVNVTSVFKQHMAKVNAKLQNNVEMLETISRLGLGAVKKSMEK